MRINFLTLFTVIAMPCFAHASMQHGAEEHPSIFHAFTLETARGHGREGGRTSLDLDGWIGGDFHKLWLKSEAERVDGKTERAEFTALYSRNIATFWDAQIGVRHDTHKKASSYLTAGMAGLAPYFFETEAHLFVSTKGDVSARVRQENDVLITQRLIATPYMEVNVSANDVPEKALGSGFTSGELGLQTRYEILRKFAPYVDVRYERKFGETASIAKQEGEHGADVSVSIGVRLLF